MNSVHFQCTEDESSSTDYSAHTQSTKRRKHVQSKHTQSTIPSTTSVEYSTFYQCAIYICFIAYITFITFWINTGDCIKPDHDVNLILQYASSQEKMENVSQAGESIHAPLIL